LRLYSAAAEWSALRITSLSTQMLSEPTRQPHTCSYVPSQYLKFILGIDCDHHNNPLPTTIMDYTMCRTWTQNHGIQACVDTGVGCRLRWKQKLLKTRQCVNWTGSGSTLVLTTLLALGSAPCSSSSFTQSKWPLAAARMSGVVASCGRTTLVVRYVTPRSFITGTNVSNEHAAYLLGWQSKVSRLSKITPLPWRQRQQVAPKRW
jgi:hypothetical protein